MSYPEITPSPPPQPPINVHGLPVYDESSVGGPYVKLPSREGGVTREVDKGKTEGGAKGVG